MKIFTSLLLSCSLLFSATYYSKLEPYEIRDISSNVSGEVVFSNENLIGKKLSSKPYVLIDRVIDKKDLVVTQEKIAHLKKRLKIDKLMLVNYKKIYDKKSENYHKIKSLSVKSKVEIDREFYDVVSSANAYLAIEKEMLVLNSQLKDLELYALRLKKSIQDKNFTHKNFVLYALYVKKNQVVSPRTLIAKIADTSKGILTLYLDTQDLENLDNKSIFLDGKKTSYKLSRISKIADVKNISKYKAQIIIDAPKLFSKLVKIELKDK